MQWKIQKKDDVVTLSKYELAEYLLRVIAILLVLLALNSSSLQKFIRCILWLQQEKEAKIFLKSRSLCLGFLLPSTWT